MTLKDYLLANAKSHAQASRELQIRPDRIRHWLADRHPPTLPSFDLMRRIYIWSNGEVDPNSFFRMDELAVPFPPADSMRGSDR